MLAMATRRKDPRVHVDDGAHRAVPARVDAQAVHRRHAAGARKAHVDDVIETFNGT